ncbi:MAG TPA: outer membrane beta-barrel protein, partial [Nannocystis sp.]
MSTIRPDSSSSRACGAVALVLAALPAPALASPYARTVQEAPARTLTAAEPIAEPILSPEPDEDAIRTTGLPGADAATRGDASAAVASGATANAEQPFRPWEVGGFIDTNYSFNSNLPDSHVNRMRSAVPRTGEFSLNLVVAYIRREAIRGQFSPTFELALQAGPAADALMYYEPKPGGDASRFAGAEVFKHIGRANVGFKTKRGTELSVGMHLSPIGIGIHWTPFNWNYTVSWELDAVPYYLAGLKLVHTIDDRHGLQLWVVNGWQTLADANKVPSLMLGYTFTPSPRFNLATFAYAGPDQTDVRMAA